MLCEHPSLEKMRGKMPFFSENNYLDERTQNLSMRMSKEIRDVLAFREENP